MCGIVSFYGYSGGIDHVLNALALLEYRAPDSAGLAVLAADGSLAVRRAVGASRELQAKLAAEPLPKLAAREVQVVMGHGRWAMVGAVTENNAHPISDRSGDRFACENGSHNATLMLNTMAEQADWWHARGLTIDAPVHRTENTTEVLTYEWERLACMLGDDNPPSGVGEFLEKLDEWGIDDPEERSLRLAVWRLREGNAHACAFYTRHRPDTLYVTSHNKPIAIARRQTPNGAELMVASDVNAALMLWTPEEVAAAAAAIAELKAAVRESDLAPLNAQDEIKAILARFTIDVLYLDANLYGGKELFARIDYGRENGRILPQVHLSRYDGTPVVASYQKIQLNPAMVGKQGYDSYTEAHIAEIPDVLDRLMTTYVRDGQVRLDSVWQEEDLLWPGLNSHQLQRRFGENLEQLHRLLLVGEGSSWRDAQAAALLLREILPGVLVHIYRPVALLNLGASIVPEHDLAVEISWSGTTDSLLKVDGWLAEMDVLRLAITGRPQSDLGRQTARSGGTLDVHTGIEVSVATVKGFEAILATLNLLALALAKLRATRWPIAELLQRTAELTLVMPQHVRDTLSNDARQRHIRIVADRCKQFNKVAVVGASPIDIEAELKIEELAQIVAGTFEFHDASLRPLVERSALMEEERHRVLFIVNATTPETCREARPFINYLHELSVFCLIHTTPHELVTRWEGMANTAVFISPQIHPTLQPLVDAPFFFNLAVALAYARGLSPDEIDRPRNLAKSVTTTGAERRVDVESRQGFRNVTLAQFSRGKLARAAWDTDVAGPSRRALRATATLRAALAVLRDPLPEQLTLDHPDHLLILTDTEATESGAHMAALAWHDLLQIDLTVYRRFVTEIDEIESDTARLRLLRAGALLAVRDGRTIALPTDMTPLQHELLTAVYLMGLAIRLARQQGINTDVWETGLAKLPFLLADILDGRSLARRLADILSPFVHQGYDKLQVIGGGQDFSGAVSITRSLRRQGFMAEALYTDSAWHGPLATVGGSDAEHDTLIVILALDPLFQTTALVDTQVYRTRRAQVILVVPAGNEDLPVVRGVDAVAVVSVTAVPRPFIPVIHGAFGRVLAQQMAQLWQDNLDN